MTRLVLTATAAVLVAACGGTNVGGPGPCDRGIPDPACSVPCVDDNQCPTGFYCGPDNSCTADCTLGSSDCGPGYSCDNGGHCFADDTGTDGNDCPSVTVTPTVRTPTVQLLIDQSGSMNDSFGGTTRWNAVKSALIDNNNGVITTLQDRVVFGASLYTYNRNNDQTCPRITKTPGRALDNRGEVASLLNNAGPDSDTPTGESIQRVIQDFQQNPPQPDSPPVILLATDGLPDRCADPDAHDAMSRQMSVSAAQQAYTAGIRTIVLSVGDQVGDAHLQEVANAGAGEDPATGTAPFYKANTPAELSAALSEIITGILSCELDLSGEIDVSRASEGIVTLNGVPLVYGVDWEVVDPNTIRILGAACDTLKAGGGTLQATFACGIIVS